MYVHGIKPKDKGQQCEKDYETVVFSLLEALHADGLESRRLAYPLGSFTLLNRRTTL